MHSKTHTHSLSLLLILREQNRDGGKEQREWKIEERKRWKKQLSTLICKEKKWKSGKLDQVCEKSKQLRRWTLKRVTPSGGGNITVHAKIEFFHVLSWPECGGTFSSFMSPSSCTMSSLLLSCRDDILCSSSSFLCLTHTQTHFRSGVANLLAMKCHF